MADKNVRPSNPGYVVVKDRSGKVQPKKTKQLNANNKRSAKIAGDLAGQSLRTIDRHTVLHRRPDIAAKHPDTSKGGKVTPTAKRGIRTLGQTAKAVLKRRSQGKDESQ